MSFNLQDDTGSVALANAYVDAAFLQGYAVDQGRADVVGGATEAQLEAAIVQATAYLDGRFQFIGWRLQLGTQTTQWPRYNAVDNDYAYVTGIPVEVKYATCEYAMRALPGITSTPTANVLNPDPFVADTGARIEEHVVRVGPIEEALRFGGGGLYQLPPYPYADMILKRRGLVYAGGTVVRGA